MSIEKLSDLSATEVEQNPYTQVCNKVIMNIKSPDAFLVWAYLLSKTKNWKVIKKDIQRQYGFGDTKIKQIFSYLKRSNLIQYVQNNENGSFGQTDIKVLVGTNFDKNEPYLNKKELESTAGLEIDPPVKKTANDRWVNNRTCGFATPLLNKESTKQRKDQNLSCASGDARHNFDEFWKLYPKKKGKADAERAWKKHKLDSVASEIIMNLEFQIKQDVQWQKVEYVPMPATYLNGQRWKDEIVKPTKKESSYTPPRDNEPKSTVQWFNNNH